MALVDQLLPPFDEEMSLTRQTLARVPADRFMWHPAPKHMTLGALTNRLITIPLWLGRILTTPQWDLSAASDGDREVAESTPELVALFNEHAREARLLLAATTDAQLNETVSILKGGEVLFMLPRLDAIKSIVLDHQARHREQLRTYLGLIESWRLRRYEFAEYPEPAVALASAGLIA